MTKWSIEIDNSAPIIISDPPMTEDEWEEFFNEKIREEVENCWHEVFKASKKIIEDANVFGFEHIEAKATPNIYQILDSLQIIELEIKIIWDKHEAGELDIADTRMIHNTKQQIFLMKNMATALKQKDINLFKEALSKLTKQAPM